MKSDHKFLSSLDKPVSFPSCPNLLITYKQLSLPAFVHIQVAVQLPTDTPYHDWAYCLGSRKLDRTHPVLGIKSPVSTPPILGILCVKSTHGLIRLAPAGIGRPISLISTKRDMHIPAPAESPMKMMSVGEIGLCVAVGGGVMRYRYAARESSRPHGCVSASHRDDDSCIGADEVCLWC
jgi:hypothetical protein